MVDTWKGMGAVVHQFILRGFAKEEYFWIILE